MYARFTQNHYYTTEYTHTINEELFATSMPFAMTTQVDRNEQYRASTTRLCFLPTLDQK